MLAAKLMSSVTSEEKLYVDDVFSAYTRTGTGADVTVTTGIDMTKGYMLWSKGRSGATDHAIYDSARGVTLDLVSNSTAAQTTQTTGLKSVSATGHTVGSLVKMNTSTATYVDFVFRKSPKFFDVVTWTGDGTTNRQIAHNLGAQIGMIVTKATSTTSDWATWHLQNGTSAVLYLNTTAASASSSGAWQVSTTHFAANLANTNGVQYVAYLFAHDPDTTDGIIQCGSFTTDGSSNATVNLGWEPQYVLYKISSMATTQWAVTDTARNFNVQGGPGSNAGLLAPNQPWEEGSVNSNVANLKLSATGFSVNNGGFGVQTFIYMAIRRPNKPPTVGTQVYNAIARTGTSTAAKVTGVGFAPDLVIDAGRIDGYMHAWWDKLRGANRGLNSSSVNTEASLTASLNSFDQNGITASTDANQWINYSGIPYINHFFKRAPGVFDQVCYTGTGVAKTEAHNLGVVPELIIIKNRSTAAPSAGWFVYSATRGPSEYGLLNSTQAFVAGAAYWNSVAPTSSVFSVANTYSDSGTDGNGVTYVAYLFASKAGISKVGSFVGNGSSQTIDCGFTTGARFILIKRTNNTGDWYVWDTTRGIIAGNDPHLSLNSVTAEVTTDDSIDPDTSGFIVNQLAATNINVTSATYIYLAFA